MLAVAFLPPGLAEIVSLLFTLLIVAILIRVLFSWFPGMSYSSFGRIVFSATEWLLGPIRRVVPPLGGMDFSPVIAIILLYVIQQVLLSGDLIGALLGGVGTILVILIILVAARVLFSFFHMDPWHPIVNLVVTSSEPLASPFRAWFPRRRSGIDWAPVAALVALLILWYAVNFLNAHRTF